MLTLTKAFLHSLPPDPSTLSPEVAKKEVKHLRFLLKNLQHERLIHLLVMLMVGLTTLITALFSLLRPTPPLLILAVLLGILFFAYLLHYFRLENTTQSCYPLLEKLSMAAKKSPSD